MTEMQAGAGLRFLGYPVVLTSTLLAGRGIAAYIHGDYEHVIETAQRLVP